MSTRRIITGHMADGRSVIIEDSPVPHTRMLPGAGFDEIWSTSATPDVLGCIPADEPTSMAPQVGPPPGGSALRIVDFPPARQGGKASPMHRTRSIDYGIILAGDIVMMLSDQEVELSAGDVVIQRGTDHAWENRSDRPARVAFVLLDAVFDAELAAIIGDGKLTR